MSDNANVVFIEQQSKLADDPNQLIYGLGLNFEIQYKRISIFRCNSISRISKFE